MKIFKTVILILTTFFMTAPSYAQNNANRPALEVEWYPPEIEKGNLSDRAKVIISGRTLPNSLIHIDGESINTLKDKEHEPPREESERQARANCKAYELPDIKSKIVGSISKNDVVLTSEYSDSWVKVNLRRGTGFVSQPCFVPSKKKTTSQGLPPAAPPPTFKIESRDVRSNSDGFFEIAMELPQGMNQVPIQVIAPNRNQKTFMITIDVSVQKSNIKMNTEISRKKPPAASKKYRFWGGAGFTYQTYSQSTDGYPNLAFNNVQAPGILARGGYWGDQWGLDFYFRDAPGMIKAEAPFQIESGDYHWQTIELKGLYQFARGPSTRLMGLPAQWQLRFGAQMHTVPFLEVDNLNNVSIKSKGVTTATLGAGLLLGQERSISYEFALGLQVPIASSGYTISAPLAYEAQLGAAYKFAPNWRLGLFSYTQSLSFSYESETSGITSRGVQNLFYTTFDLRLGYEF